MKTITYDKYNRIIDRYNKSVKSGLIPIIKKNYLKLGLGVSCLIIAVIPNGLGLIFYPLGFYLLGIGIMDVEKIQQRIKQKIKRKVINKVTNKIRLVSSFTNL